MTPSPDPSSPSIESKQRRPAARWIWLAAGLLCVALGFVGAFVPLMPTTVFLILAAACFARSSPRLERWLLDHPRFGPTLRAWRKEKAIPRTGKIMACVGMAAGLSLFWWGAHPRWPLLLLVGGIIGACAAYVVTRPAPSKRA
ncbi:MAG: YbaN family protein [Caulobacter sp.]|nr:YbaN family protein [Caulobacter sp.]